MFQKISLFCLSCQAQDLTWTTDNSFFPYFNETENMGRVLYSQGKLYSLDFISFKMINPFHDLDIPLYVLFTIVLNVALAFLCRFLFICISKQNTWRSTFCGGRNISTSPPINHDSLSPPFWRGHKRITLSAIKKTYDYECFDCTFASTSREEINLHSRLCVLGVSRLFSNHNHKELNLLGNI